jgi:peptide subunit release factor RF-3
MNVKTKGRQKRLISRPASAVLCTERNYILAGLVTCLGSSYRNVGVQPLMDAVIDYAPSPADRHYPFLQYYQVRKEKIPSLKTDFLSFGHIERAYALQDALGHYR